MKVQTWYYVWFNDAEHGPLTAQTVMKRFGKGKGLPQEIFIRESSMSEWVDLREMLGLWREEEGVSWRRVALYLVAGMCLGGLFTWGGLSVPQLIRGQVNEVLVSQSTAETPSRPAETREIFNWMPSMVSEEWRDVRMEVPRELAPRLESVIFRFERGGNRLDISKVSFFVDGKLISADEHQGQAGDIHQRNEYRLSVPDGLQVKESSYIIVNLRTDDGCDSYGKVTVTTH